ncbi:hypothetical protein QBC37DRAFT_300548 [Rhypophila decipiens]|uniref:Ferric oxidoreductase domain-containing protein n=1 Tax=Rhypophila decipiens TaxID=261697 RepID=A0AAN6XTS8_9PEZI|nr:hypothetical protein QBC37DRAFT_300548 [Rhypophila decipiens]
MVTLGLRRFFRIRTIQSWTLRFLIYPLVIQRSTWNSVTLFQALIVMTYVGTNLALIFYYKSDFPKVANLFSLNLVPLFIAGPVADYLDIPLQTYHLAHHWIGRLAIIQGFVHAVATYIDGRSETSQQATGAALGLSLLSTVIATSFIIRRLSYKWFQFLHYVLIIAIVASLILHLIFTSTSFTTTPWISVYCCGALWLRSSLLRRLLMQYRGCVTAYVRRFEGVTRIIVPTNFAVKARPGSYFYIYFTRHPLFKFHGHFAPVIWWDPDVTNYTKEVSFLLPHTDVRLQGESQSINLKVCLDGPYGQDLAIGQYGTVILVADGEGIAGVLPFALSLVSRKNHDMQAKKSHSPSLYCDEVRKVDLFWKLDSDTQAKWTLDYFLALANIGKATRVRTIRA